MISAIVANYNGAEYIKGCLGAVLGSDHLDLEIIVVDDGSGDGSLQILQTYKERKNVRVLKLGENKGAAAARNIGAKHAKGELLFFLDVDTQVKKDCLRSMEEAFVHDKKLGAGQAKLILKETGEIETAGHFLSPFGFPYEVDDPRELRDNKIFGGRSAALAVRRNLFKKIGRFDEDYKIYGEDTDLCWRVRLAGYEIKYIPEAEVLHWSKSSIDSKSSKRVFYEGAKNSISNILKNAKVRTVLWLMPLHFIGWIAVSARLVFRGKLAKSRLVYVGMLWNLLNIKKTLAKRITIPKHGINGSKIEKSMFGPLNLNKIIRKGLYWLQTVK